MLADILGKNRLRSLGFDIPTGKATARQAVMLNKAAEELPSESDITKAGDIELQKIAEKASGIISQIKDVQTDTEDLFEHPISWILNRAKDVVGWVSQNIWALVVGIGGLIYTYMVTRK